MYLLYASHYVNETVCEEQPREWRGCEGPCVNGLRYIEGGRIRAGLSRGRLGKGTRKDVYGKGKEKGGI